MNLVSFAASDRRHWGVTAPGGVVALSDRFPQWRTLRDVIAAGGIPAVLDDPVTGILWLVRRLAHYGMGQAAGDVVLSGSFIRPVECPPGSHIEADFGPFGAVSVRFA